MEVGNIDKMDDNEQDLNAMKRTRSSNLAQLTKLYKELEKKMVSYDNVNSVKELYGKLSDRFEQFSDVHAQCIDLCTQPEVVETLELNYISCKENFDEFRERYSGWIKGPEENLHDDAEVGSNISSVSRSRSRFLEAKTRRLKAALQLKKLKEKQEIERARKELELKDEILQQETAVEEAELEEAVWCAALNEETSGTTNPDLVLLPCKENPTNESDRKSKGSTTGSVADSVGDVDDDSEVNFNLHAKAYGPNTGESQTSVNTIESVFQQLASTLQEGFNLPKPELLTFSGKPIDYCKFIKNFETNVESKVSDNQMKLSYLIQYCKGEARSSIEDCVLLDKQDGYKRARDILYSRYGRSHMIARSYVDKLVYGEPIKASDVDVLSALALEMQKCEITLSQLGFVSDIDNSDSLRRIVKRLPTYLRVKWVDVAHSIMESGREPRFSDLSKFIDQKVRVANSTYGLDLVRESKSHVSHKSHGSHKESEVKTKVTTLTTQNKKVETSQRTSCVCCSGTCNDLALCHKFKSMSLEARSEFVKLHKLCFNCLKGKHFSRLCRRPKVCQVSECKGKHHTLLHKWVKFTNDQNAADSSVNCTTKTDVKVKTCLGIVPVVITGKNGKTYKTHALLDDGADKSMCDERLLNILDIQSQTVTFKVTTMTSIEDTMSGHEVDLKVGPVNGGKTIPMSKVWSVKRLPISTKSAAPKCAVEKYDYLCDLDLPEIDSDDVTLLIGSDAPFAHIPLEVRAGRHDQPYAIRSCLGWAVRGPLEAESETKTATVHYQRVNDEVLQQQLERMWNTDFNEVTSDNKYSMSVEDKQARRTMESTISYEDGHYKLGLPWRDNDSTLPNNLALAHARLNQLKRKLSRDPELHKMYTTTVNDYIKKGYAKRVENETDGTSAKRVWYLPHHPVQNENKPGKVRVVFDCAAKFQGVSLNNKLLQGPDLMNSLVGVLIRFRQENVAVTADIEAMFHQVRVQEEDRDALRFLWWPDGDLDKEPATFCMTVHLFGATSSPSCAAFAMKRTIEDNAEMFQPEVAKTVERNFYVDDCLKSVTSEKEAIELATNLQSLLKEGGFRLTKWISNKRAVLDAIPEAERSPHFANICPSDVLPTDRALGVIWDVNNDKIKFKVKLADKPVTRRGVLSIVCSIYDPLGFVSPVTFRAKRIVQELCRLKLGWDDPIPSTQEREWIEWMDRLPEIEKISIHRCYKPESFDQICNAQLHIFSDGSESGYGACAYLRLVDGNGNVSISLVMGKSRLAPIKQSTIPRLELSGAVVACRLYELISSELEIDLDHVTFWTDSMIVLGYINNTSRRFKTFVGNRLSEIHNISSPEQWRYVDTNSNPADIASRGMDVKDATKINMWLNGPDFLQHEPQRWPQNPSLPGLGEDDAEVKSNAQVLTVTAENVTSTVDDLIKHYSCIRRLQRAVAWMLRFKTYCTSKFLKSGPQCETGPLTLPEIKDANRVVLRRVQGEAFQDELKRLENNQSVKKSSRLATLNPVVEDGLILCKGRASGSNNYPIILPGEHHVTQLIIRYKHESLGHVGTQQVLATTRRQYWILKGTSTVRKVLRSCVLCRRQRGSTGCQQMAPLLEEQMTPDKPPFTYVGIDYFGPLLVKQGRSSVKRYGCLFSCLTTRAVHLEIAHSLTTDSFLAAFSRFVSRRGTPEKVYSDNGTNLVAGEQEIRKQIAEWNRTKIDDQMTQNHIIWEFNPPYASHRGGAWERMIRSCRTILKALAGEQLLTDEKLLTLVAEVEKIINDRPITTVSNDPNDPNALTPSMLLLMKNDKGLPQGLFNPRDVYAKRWWRQVQYLADVFWRRWIHEYLPSLQTRQKWQQPNRNVQKGDVVLVVDEKVPRGQWPLGRIIDVIEGRDGLVRSCMVKFRNTSLIKPITKLCPLEC